MPKLTEPVKQQRREHIARAAQQCFARKGLAGTSMSDIIAESGLSAGAIYSHFTGKADLVRFTSRTMLEARGRSLLRMSQDSEHAPSPNELMQHMAAFLVEEEFSPVLLDIWADAARDSDIAQVVRENLEYVRTLLAQVLTPWAEDIAVAPEEPQALALRAADLVLTTAHGFLLRITIDPHVDARRLLDDLVNLPRAGMPREADQA